MTPLSRAPLSRAAALAAYLLVGGTIQAQRPAGSCGLDFDSTYVVITRDYAGYQDRLRENGPRITALTDSVRAALVEAPDSTCTPLLQRWIAPFAEHDHHLQLWQPRSEAAGQGARASGEDRRRPSLEFRDDSTAVLTLPDFAERYKPAIDSLIASHRGRLLATPYLVVDVRRNGGGATRAYAEVVPLLYTDPIARDGMELWVSEGNLAMARAMVDDPRTPPGMKAEAARLLPQLERSLGRFFSMGAIDSLKLDTVYALPRAVVVLTGRGCASSCEQFVLDAMHSKKVTVVGTEHTAGFLDYGNIRTITLPSGIRRLAYATSRSHRLPERPMDYTGIVPQVLIPMEETDGLAFAIRYLKSRK